MFTRLPEYRQRLPLPTYAAWQQRQQEVAEMDKRGILMDVHCGREDWGYVADGFDWRLVEGYTFQDSRLWPGEVDYCWASWEDLVAELTCPRRTGGLLRLFIIDPDAFQGGRQERVFCEGRELGVFADFVKGRWVETQISPEDTRDRKIELRIENARQGANVVVSRVQLLRAGAPPP